MELRRLAVCMALFVLAVSQCSDARHSMQRRQVFDGVTYDDNALADEADDDTQNDTNDSESSQETLAVIETAPQTYKVQSGKDQKLECEVSSNDTGAVVQWYKNNELYFMGSISLQNENGRYSIESVRDSSTKNLIIRNVQASDNGIFRCEIAQKVPVAINHTLMVTEKPKVVNMTATNSGYVVEDSELRITCHVTGSPVPTVLWTLTRHTHPIAPDTVMDSASNERLTENFGEFSANGNVFSLYIKNVKREQAGTYYCYAFNDVGNHQAETTVVVHRKPRVHVTKSIVNSDLQIEAVLKCAAHEENRPHIRWYKDGVLIEDSSSNYKISTRGSRSNLTVFPTVDSDFGTFTCEAENDYGTHNRSVELVQSPVVEDLEVDGAKMSWTVHSYQPLEEMEVQLKSNNIEDNDAEWRRLAVPLPQEGNGHQYEVSYLLDDKQLEPGEYQAIVKVKNSKSWGGSNGVAVVKIEEAQPQYIQHASVFRENAAHSIRPEFIVLCTFLMSLIARML